MSRVEQACVGSSKMSRVRIIVEGQTGYGHAPASFLPLSNFISAAASISFPPIYYNYHTHRGQAEHVVTLKSRIRDLACSSQSIPPL